MTTAEAAAQLRMTRQHVAALCKRGVIAATWSAYARRWAIEPAEVERYLRTPKNKGGRPRRNAREP
jgi:excisionase family DNA binding protein